MRNELRANLIVGLSTALLAAAQSASAQSAPGRYLADPEVVGHTVSDPGVPVALSAQSTSAHPFLPAGQVWQCIRDGQRIFSDAPCGAGSTIRQLNDVNRMDAAPAGAAHYYPPPRDAYAAYPAPTADDAAPQQSDPVYVTQAVAIIDRGHDLARTHRPHHHDPRPVPARAAHAAAH